MIKLNENFLNLGHNYLFSEIAQRVAAFKKNNPSMDVISLGIGDVTRPLAPVVVEAMHKAVDDCATVEGFYGYGPTRGYDFLLEKIAEYDYAARGVKIDTSEIFVNDGAKSDLGNIGDILSGDCVVGVTDPVYPVYVDSNVMAGRKIVYIPCNASNDFTGDIPEQPVDFLYLCYPNNPTGAAITREKLSAWVDYARRNRAIILYDSAYVAYISDPELPHSIFEIPGAEECAIEFRSFSKTAGFTGVRCGYTVIPRKLVVRASNGSEVSVRDLWERRQNSKFNGASCISQCGAAALYTPEGQKQVRDTIGYYMENARLISAGLSSVGLKVYGGVDSPYIWASTPEGTGSWEFFDTLLHAGVVTTPGEGFGKNGEGYIRITAFGGREATEKAIDRIIKNIK